MNLRLRSAGSRRGRCFLPAAAHGRPGDGEGSPATIILDNQTFRTARAFDPDRCPATGALCQDTYRCSRFDRKGLVTMPAFDDQTDPVLPLMQATNHQVTPFRDGSSSET